MKPIYIPPSLSATLLADMEDELLSLSWETKRAARHEYFMADRETDYAYGRQDDGVSYTSKPWSPYLHEMRDVVAMWTFASLFREGIWNLQSAPRLIYTGFFNGCFLNKYDDQHQHLGWHADDFAGMDAAAPITVMSFGAEREIWVKPQDMVCPVCKGEKMFTDTSIGARNTIELCGECRATGRVAVKGAVPPADRYLLERGSLFVMPPGFQAVMLHRIPKHSTPCGWRISLTFRRFHYDQ